MATSGYQAGVEVNGSQISYGIESAWGTSPGGNFQAIRYTGESLSLNKTRQRPNEILDTREMAAAVTTKQEAKGSINFSLSYGTFDDFFATLLANPFGTAISVAGAAGDITITAGASPVLSSATAGKFTGISANQWIRTLGFTNASNNGFWWVSAATGTSLTLSGPQTAITETPAGTAAQVRARTNKNGTTFQSLYVQQLFSSSLALCYPGLFVTGMSLSGGIGKMIEGSFDCVAQTETSFTSNQGGTVVAAPSGRVFDPVSGFKGVLWNSAKFPNVVDSFTLKVTNQSADSEYGLGSPTAQGILMGSIEVTGTLKTYFPNFTQYQQFASETSGNLAFITGDNAGNVYVFTVPVATMNADAISAGGPNQPVYCDIQFMGDPMSMGGSIIIDKLPAT